MNPRSVVLAVLAAAVTSASVTGQAPPAKGPGKTSWAPSFAEARQSAAKNEKYVFVEFVKENCGNCQRMEGLLYPTFNFEAFLMRMVPTKLNLEEGEGAALAQKYGVDDAPSALIVSPEGTLIFRMVGFLNQEDFYSHAYQDIAAYDQLKLRMLNEPSFLDNAKAQLQLGKDLYRRYDALRAIPRLRRAADSPKAPAALRDEALSYLASAELDSGDSAGARQVAETLIRTSRSPDVRQKAELFLAQVDVAEGKNEDAYQRLLRFKKENPKSAHLKEAEEFLSRFEVKDLKPKP